MRYLDEKKIGYRVGPSTIPAGETIIVPIVPAAILIDLSIGDWRIRPNAESGYQACLAAGAGKVPEGNVGAGAGATVGKFFGNKFAMKSGLGTASIRAGNSGIVVAAMAAVNAAGDVYEPQTAKSSRVRARTMGKIFAIRWHKFGTGTMFRHCARR